MEILITICVGAAGGLFGKKMKWPVGAMTGSLAAVLLLKVFFQQGYLPPQTKVMLQILSGAMIGSRVTRRDVAALKNMWLAAVVLVLGMIGMNLCSAGLMYGLSPLDFVTAYFASAPGGLQDMALIAADFGADALTVSVCQVCRVLFILMVYPVLYRLISEKGWYPGAGAERRGLRGHTTAEEAGRYPGAGAERRAQERKDRAADEAAPAGERGQSGGWNGVRRRPGRDEDKDRDKVKNKEDCGRLCAFCLTILSAVAGGILLKYTGVTAGALLGALIATAGYHICSGNAYFPDRLKSVLQILTGAYVGMQVGRDTLFSMKDVLFPTLVMLFGTTVFIYLISLLLRRVTKLDFMTCLMICTPGGLQEMCLMADDMECDVPKIVLMHTVRIVIVIALCPAVLHLLLAIAG